MQTPGFIAVGLLLAYLAGSIPFAHLIARAHGVDIRKVGSGNVGATNVFRAVGKGWGVLTFALDVLKGALPAALIVPAIALIHPPALPPAWKLAFGVAAIAGHNWPIFLGFKGGKGVATSAGMLIAAAPSAIGIGFGVWLISFLFSRYVSLASIIAAAAVPAAGWWLYRGEGIAMPLALTVLGALTIWRHRSNLIRLREGTEHRFDFSRSPRAKTGGG